MTEKYKENPYWIVDEASEQALKEIAINLNREEYLKWLEGEWDNQTEEEDTNRSIVNGKS